MSRSTFSILPYINRQKVKADGTANILCRITVDGKSAAISTGISCTPQEWNAKKGEVRNARDNGRLASFLAEVKDKYNSLLTTNGIITVEILKAALKDKNTTGRFLLNFGDTIVEWYRTARARQTFLHKRTWQKNLRAFVHTLGKEDIAFEDIDENFGEEYKLFLKRDQGRIDSYVNHCLLWLNMLMYKAVDRSIIRFNPIARIGYEKLWKNSVELFRSMEIPVRQLNCCSGDLADLKVKSCDIEAWSPRQQKYFEVCSCSNLGDAQARRLHIRVKGKDGKTYLAHTLNNTCVAPPRMLIAFLENHLQADGSVTIPKVLQPYMGGLEVMVPTHKKG